ncbi:MAG: hypothetical protein JO009_11400, partial [Candidatus Eremiobacteraeota bacterium]|nr:hypothetical protein [Candidatus Eremiobacteraeota bacterium]
MTKQILAGIAAVAFIGASASADPTPTPAPVPTMTPAQAPSAAPSPSATPDEYVLRPDLNNGSWVQGPTLPSPRQNAAVAVLNGRIYLIGGFGSNLRQTDTTLVLQPPL